MRKIASGLLVAIMIAALVAGLTVTAQPSGYTVDGYVRDSSSNEVLSDVQVRLTGNGMDQSRNTDNGGYYQFQDVPSGSYSLQFSAGDFNSKGVSVTVTNTDVTQNVQLNPTSGSGNGGGSGSDSPFGNFDTGMLETMVYVGLILMVVFFVCLITITIALCAMFVRMGKVRKELTEINENLEELREKPTPQNVMQPQMHMPPQQWVQQPPPPPQTQ